MINSDIQAFSTQLSAISALSVSDGNFIVGNGSTWVVESVGNARTSLGLGSIATQASDTVAITGGAITGTTVNGFLVGTNAIGTRTISTSDASGGADGDIHYKY